MREETVKSELSHRDRQIVLTVTTFEGRVLQSSIPTSAVEYQIEPRRLAELISQNGIRVR